MKNETIHETEKPSPSGQETGRGSDGGGSAAARRAPEKGGGQALRRWWQIFQGTLSLRPWGLRRRTPTKSFGGRSRLPVQQELALENVRPCRNDLNDADWELARPPQGGARLAFLRNLATSQTSASRAARAAVRGLPAARV
jgi:hypothetical protein